MSKNGYVKKLEGNFSAEKSKIWGGYYDPPYSAECQIKKKSATFMKKNAERKKMETKKKRVSISLTDEQYELVDKIAKSRGFSKSAIFVLALEEYLKNQKQN